MNIKNITKGHLNVREMADLFGLSVQAVYKWEKSGRIPSEYCRAIEEKTEGAITRYELRPDIFGPAPCNCNQIEAAA